MGGTKMKVYSYINYYNLKFDRQILDLGSAIQVCWEFVQCPKQIFGRWSKHRKNMEKYTRLSNINKSYMPVLLPYMIRRPILYTNSRVDLGCYAWIPIDAAHLCSWPLVTGHKITSTGFQLRPQKSKRNQKRNKRVPVCLLISPVKTTSWKFVHICYKPEKSLNANCAPTLWFRLATAVTWRRLSHLWRAAASFSLHGQRFWTLWRLPSKLNQFLQKIHTICHCNASSDDTVTQCCVLDRGSKARSKIWVGFWSRGRHPKRKLGAQLNLRRLTGSTVEEPKRTSTKTNQHIQYII